MSITNVGHGQVLTFDNSTATKGPKGDTGVTFVPEINDGILSFQNDGQLPNPGSVDLGSYAIPAESELATARTAHDGTALPSLKEAMDYNYDELANQIAIDESRILTLENRATSNESRLDTAEPKITALQADAVSLDARLDIAEPKITALQADAVSLDGRLDAAEPKITSLETQMAAEKPKIATLQSEMAAEKAKIATLQSEMAAEKPKTVTLQSDMTAEKAKIVTLQGDSASHKSRLDTAEPKITTLQADVAAEKPKVSTLQSDMIAEKAKISTLQADNTTNKANIATLQSGKADKLMATNLVTNGDFSNGTTGFVADGTASVNSGVVTFTANNCNGKFRTTSMSVTTGHKYYMRVRVLAPYTNVFMMLYDGVNSYLSPSLQTSGVWSSMSHIATASTTSASGQFQFVRDSSDSGWQPIQLSHPLVIDLTATFGAGNEPTLAEMDAMMAQYPNSWFNGTQEILPLTEVWKNFNRKADKLMATNLVSNGDFSNGTTGWLNIGANVSVTNGQLRCDTTSSVGVRQEFSILSGHQVYVSATAYADNTTNTVVLRFLNSSSAIISPYLTLPNTSTPTRASTIIPLPEQAISFGTARMNTNPNVVYIDNITVINLTATFGAGNEPTLAEMDAMMAQYSNSWFNGTQEILPLTEVWKNFNRKADKLMATNLITNGDFSNGTTGWLFVGCTASIENGYLKVTMNNQLKYGEAYTYTRPAKTNDKVYARLSIKQDSSRTTSTNIVIRERDSANNFLKNNATVCPVTVGVWGQHSTITTLSSPTCASVNFVAQTGFNTEAEALGETFNIDNFIGINLTATFGAGNEPTLAEMDLLMSQFSNAWFDGTQELLSLKAIQKELSSKASIAQEAWITPTLTNGFTHGTVPLRYRKLSIGLVQIKGQYTGGTVFGNLFVLPIGYRPASHCRVNILSSYSSGVFNIENSGLVTHAVGTTTNTHYVDFIYAID